MTHHVLSRDTDTDHDTDTTDTSEVDLLPPEAGRGLDMCPHCHTDIDGPEDATLDPVSSTGSMYGLYCDNCDRMLFTIPEHKLDKQQASQSTTTTAQTDD